MRHLPLLALGLLLPLPSFAAELMASSSITAVTVYADRASITREAKVDLPAGDSTVVLENLPIGLFPDSLRAEGAATAAVTLGAIENKLVAGTELTGPREQEISTELQKLSDDRQIIEGNIAALNARKEFLTNLGKQATLRSNENIAELKLNPADWTGAALALQTNLAEADKGLVEQNAALRQLDLNIQKLNTELAQLQTGQRNSYKVMVPLTAKAPTTLTLKVTYQLGGAMWQPIYDARLDTASGKLNLLQYGEVRQQTGEDWSNVALTLSTAQPARGATPPLLSTMWVDIQQMLAYGGTAPMAKAARGVQNLSAVSEMATMDSAVAMAPPPELQAATFEAATLNAGGYVGEYVIAGKANVPADNTAKKLMIGALDTSSELLVQVRPQLTSEAFLMAKTKLGGEVPLLPGSASLFRDGAFIGSALLPMLRPGEETHLGFGIDDQVLVKHRVLADVKGEAGVIAKDTTLERKVQTEVHNLHSFATTVEVLQAVPTPRDERIKLTILSNDTTPGFQKDVNDTTGLYKWSLKLAPQAKETVKLGWTLAWPSGENVSGVY